MDRGYNVTQVQSIFYSKCKLIIVITVVAYIGLLIAPISAIVVCPFTTCINYNRPMHVFNLLTYVGLYMYACMYACMYVCMHACMYVCMHACMHACMIHMYVCMHACMHACMYACMHV